jgi:2-polyprenyl-3-methyl-5-hydroxy-6-metoxy-1,4-benzoquinol methylase
VSLAGEYRRQSGWRSGPDILAALPRLEGATVLDLGCGVGDQAALLAARGARVLGFDMNEELLGEARSRSIAGAVPAAPAGLRPAGLTAWGRRRGEGARGR